MWDWLLSKKKEFFVSCQTSIKSFIKVESKQAQLFIPDIFCWSNWRNKLEKPVIRKAGLWCQCAEAGVRVCIKKAFEVSWYAYLSFSLHKTYSISDSSLHLCPPVLAVSNSHIHVFLVRKKNHIFFLQFSKYTSWVGVKKIIVPLQSLGHLRTLCQISRA